LLIFRLFFEYSQDTTCHVLCYIGSGKAIQNGISNQDRDHISRWPGPDDAIKILPSRWLSLSLCAFAAAQSARCPLHAGMA
jgi:hypothetical protein